jgi:hypothetical protein
MQRRGLQVSTLPAAIGLTGSLVLNICMAAPPGAAPQNLLIPRANVAQALGRNLPVSLGARLDLRAPAHVAEAPDAAFPSALIRRRVGGVEESAQLPSLGVGNPRSRPPMEELARHVQHEGLPLARLWENKSALVHIGLNQRGKPGLWLVQKIH